MEYLKQEEELQNFGVGGQISSPMLNPEFNPFPVVVYIKPMFLYG